MTEFTEKELIYLKRITDFLSERPNKRFNIKDLSKSLKIPLIHTRTILSFLLSEDKITVLCKWKEEKGIVPKTLRK